VQQARSACNACNASGRRATSQCNIKNKRWRASGGRGSCGTRTRPRASSAATSGAVRAPKLVTPCHPSPEKPGSRRAQDPPCDSDGPRCTRRHAACPASRLRSRPLGSSPRVRVCLDGAFAPARRQATRCASTRTAGG
jgi:hypothetical protein